MKTINVFVDEIYSKSPEKNYATNKTDLYHFDDFWSLDILGLKSYCPENRRGYRYVLVVIILESLDGQLLGKSKCSNHERLF